MRNLMQKEDGFTLLELLLVIGVGAILLLAGIGTYGLVTEGNKVNEAQRTIATVKQQVQSLYQGQTSYGGSAGTPQDLTSVLNNAGLFPTTALDSSGDPITPWDTGLIVEGIGDGVRVTFEDLEQSVCIQIARMDFSNDPDYIQTARGGTVIGTAGVTPSAADADGACTATAADNDIQFEFF